MAIETFTPNKVILAQWFFPGKVIGENGNIQPAPEEVLVKRNNLCREWLRNTPIGKGVTFRVDMNTVYRSFPTGWSVTAVVIHKPNTVQNCDPVRNS